MIKHLPRRYGDFICRYCASDIICQYFNLHVLGKKQNPIVISLEQVLIGHLCFS